MAHESLLHAIWEKQHLGSRFCSTCGRRIEIIHPGEANPHAGPDFLNARIRIGSILWSGNVEIHFRASDWVRHGHHRDPAYTNVILHLVRQDDQRVFDLHQRIIPALVLPDALVPKNLNTFPASNEKQSMCRSRIPLRDTTGYRPWIDTLYRLRLEEQIRPLRLEYHARGMNWEKCLLLALGKGFGTPLNALPFALTCRQLPLELLYEIRNDRTKLESLLFGQSGLFLSSKGRGPFERELRRSFTQLKSKKQETPLQAHLWKYMRLRPGSFPALRISQFAALLHRYHPLLPWLLKCRSLPEFEQLLDLHASEYWTSHYHLGRKASLVEKKLGLQSRHTILINGIIPFLHLYGTLTGRWEYREIAGDLIRTIPPEQNHIMRWWSERGIRARSAMESQALIHFYNKYCKQRRCFDCQIAILLFQGPFHE